jgi:type II secretory pathway pseudopilin PulG
MQINMKNKLIQLIAVLLAIIATFAITLWLKSIKLEESEQNNRALKQTIEKFEEYRRFKKEISKFDIIESYLVKPNQNGV